jgi:hypothetical protein
MEHVLQRIRDVADLAHRAGPYVLLELLLPVGTLIALALFVYRRGDARRHAGSPVGPFDRLLERVLVRLDDALDLRVVAARSPDGKDDGLEPLGLPAS